MSAQQRTGSTIIYSPDAIAMSNRVKAEEAKVEILTAALKRVLKALELTGDLSDIGMDAHNQGVAALAKVQS